MASIVVAASALLPWHQSGSVRRNGFALARVADRLGLVSGVPLRILYVTVFLLPLLAAATFASVVLGRPRVVGVVTCATGLVGLASSCVVFRTVRIGQPGPLVALAAGLVAVVVGVRLTLVPSVRGRNLRDV